MLKIRRPLGRLIFNMEIAIPGKTVFLIETAPWKEHYERLSNVEFDWDTNSLTEVYHVEGLAPHITLELVFMSTKLIWYVQAAGTSLIAAEILRDSGVDEAQ